MKRSRAFVYSSLLTAITLTIGILLTTRTPLIQSKAFSYSDDTIRVYITVTDSVVNGFFKPNIYPNIKVYAYGKDASDNLTTAAYPGTEATRLLNSYSGDGSAPYGNALYYIDLPSSTTKVQFFNEQYFRGYNYDRTVTINIGENYDGRVYKGTGQLYEPGNPEHEYIVGYFEDLSFSVSEFGSFIDGYDSCSSSEETGYNAVPYLDYYYATYATINNTVTLTEPGYGESAGGNIQVGVQDKWEAMVARYQFAHSD